MAVSVVIPCFNLGQYLPEAVESVLRQTLPAGEVIVVDDGSTDELTLRELDRMAAAGVTVLHQKNQGAPAARNNGIQIATGDYILCLDADDLLEPTFLEETSEKLDTMPGVGIVTSYVQFIGNSNEIWRTDVYPNRLSSLLWQNLIASASLFRKKCWQEAGGYANLMAYQDWNFWISIVEKGWRWHTIARPLYRYRVRDGSITSKAEGHRKSLIAAVVSLHKETYQAHCTDVFIEMDEELAKTRQMVKKYSYDSINLKKVIQTLQQATQEKDRQAAALADTLNARDSKIAELWEELARKDEKVAGLWEELARKDEKIASLWNEVALRDRQIDTLAQEEVRKDEKIAGLWDELALRDRRIEALDGELAQRDQKICSLEASLRRNEAMLSAMRDENQRLQAEFDEERNRWRQSALRYRVRLLAEASAPVGSTVLVVNKGDSTLLEMHGRRGWHFPQAADGGYLGWYPATSEEAIAQLEALRAKGADHLLFPATALWWFDYYPGFKAHLGQHYTCVAQQDDVGILYALRSPGHPVAAAAPRGAGGAVHCVIADRMEASCFDAVHGEDK